MKPLFSTRALLIYALLVVLFSMAFAIYLQFFKGMEPCSLCVFQRLSYIAYALIIIIALIHHPRYWGIRVYAILSMLPCIVGFLMAARQFWIQSLPAHKVPACGPGLNFLLQEFKVFKVVQVVWAGSSDCAIVGWRFLGMSMAFWSAVLFVVLFALSVLITFRKISVNSF